MASNRSHTHRPSLIAYRSGAAAAVGLLFPVRLERFRAIDVSLVSLSVSFASSIASCVHVVASAVPTAALTL